MTAAAMDSASATWLSSAEARPWRCSVGWFVRRVAWWFVRGRCVRCGVSWCAMSIRRPNNPTQPQHSPPPQPLTRHPVEPPRVPPPLRQQPGGHHRQVVQVVCVVVDHVIGGQEVLVKIREVGGLVLLFGVGGQGGGGGWELVRLGGEVRWVVGQEQRQEAAGPAPA